MDTQQPCPHRILKLPLPRPTASVLSGLSVLLLSMPGLAQVALVPDPGSTPTQPGRLQLQTAPNSRFRISSIFQTPSRGMPGRRAGGGTRGDDCIQGSVPFLLALLPRTNLGLTTHAYPSFFWYLPQTTAQTAEFQLYKVGADGQSQDLLYETTLPIAGGNKIASLTLPQQPDLAPLVVGEDYQWSLAMICDPDNRDRDLRVEGWVQRIADNSAADALQAVNPYDRIAHYAEQGIWFDALETLHTLRCEQPQDPILAASWETFLASVGLSPVAQQPLSQPCGLTALDNTQEANASPASSLK